MDKRLVAQHVSRRGSEDKGRRGGRGARGQERDEWIKVEDKNKKQPRDDSSRIRGFVSSRREKSKVVSSYKSY